LRPLKLGVVGACGRMGRRILSLGLENPEIQIAAAVENEGHPEMGREVAPGVALGSDPEELMRRVEVYIDFSSPESSLAAAAAAGTEGTGAVIGTTGFTERQGLELAERCGKIAWILAPNMSFGVAVLAKLVRDAAGRLGRGYDVEIVETHHRRKKDAPSGTALHLARAASGGKGWTWEEVSCFGRHGSVGPREEERIAVHAVRGGDVVGEHRVMFLGPGESVELVHRAESRDTFAQGAIKAALFLRDRPAGRYEIADVVLGAI